VQLSATTQHGCQDDTAFTITVYPNPIAQINLTNGNSFTNCAPFTIDSTVISTTQFVNNNDSYEWIYTDVNGYVVGTSIDFIPFSHPMNNDSDTIYISLVAYSNQNCVNDTVTVMFTTIPDPVALFATDTISGCHPLDIEFTYSGSEGVSYYWDFDFTNIESSINLSSLEGPHTITYSNTWQQDTSYTIELIVGDTISMCTDTIYQQILVHPLPVPLFVATEECYGDTTVFIDNSYGVVDSISVWNWDFGDNINFDSIPNTSCLYDSSGIYEVCLTVTDLNGCANTLCEDVIVRPNPIASFEMLYSCFPEPGCSNEIIGFNSTSTLDFLGGYLDTAYWYINSLLDTMIVEPDTFNHVFTAGQYEIGALVFNSYGCYDYTNDSLYIVDIPTANFSLSADTMCVGDSLFITSNNSSGYILNYEWVIYGDTNDTLFIFNSSNQTPPAIPHLPQGINDTTYTLSLTSSNCCGSATYYEYILIEPLPIVNFAMTDSIICSQQTIEFTLEPFIFGGTDSIIVNFGDGYEITVQPDTIPPFVWDNFYHQFIGDTITGQDTTYYITMIGYNHCGDSTITHPIIVKPNAIQSFFTTNLWFDTDTCESVTATFIENSTAPPNANVSWCFDWDYTSNSCNIPFTPNPGPGNFILGDTIQYQYNIAGEYTVMHTINDGVCNYDTSYFDVIIVFPNPVANFTPLNGCLNDTITFVNTSFLDANIINQPTTITGYNWYVDGVFISSTDVDLEYSFNTIGLHNISLVAYTDRGCTDSTTFYIQIYALPTASFTTDSVCFNATPTNFTDISQTGANNSGIVNWNWDFGDVTSTNNQQNGIIANPNHLYTIHGLFYTTLIIEDNLGCKDTVTNSVRVWNNPTADFIADTMCQGIGTPFTGISSTGDGDIQDWSWNFGDLSPVISESDSVLTHVFPNSGNFYSTLTVTDEHECTDDFSDSVKVWALPISSFSSSTNCQEEVTVFSNNSYLTDGSSIVSFFWTLDDINSGPLNTNTSENPTHIYTDCGTFLPTLNIVDDLGCIGVNQVLTDVICNPTAEFTIYDTICDGEVTNFADLATSNNSNSSLYINQYNWNISPGVYINSSSTSSNPSFLFDSCSTSFTAELIVELNQYGCKDTVAQEVTVHCNPDALFSSTVSCYGSDTQFDDLSIFGDTIIEYWNWYEIGAFISNEQNPNITLNNSGFVPVELVVTDFNGCYDSYTENITVYNTPAPSFSVDDICAGEDAIFYDNSSQNTQPSNPIVFWNWSFGDGISLNQNSSDSVTHYYNIDEFIGNVFNTTLTLIDSLGCRDSIIEALAIHPIPIVDFEITNSCENDLPLQLIENSGLSNNIHPFFSNETLDSTATLLQNGVIISNQLLIQSTTDFYPNTFISDPVDTSLYSMLIETSFGCQNSTSEIVYIFDNPDIEILNIQYSSNPPCGDNISVELQSDISDLINPTNNPPFINYWWEFSFNNNLPPHSTLQNPTVLIEQPSNDTIITLHGMNTFNYDGIVYECISIDTSFIQTFPNINVDLLINPLTVCEPQSFILDGNYNPIGAAGVVDPMSNWSFLIETSDSIYFEFNGNAPNIISPVNSVSLNTINAANTNYTASLYVETENGCSSIDEELITLYPTPIPGFTYDSVLTEEGAYYGEYIFHGSAESAIGTSLHTPLYNFSWSINGEEINLFGEDITYRFPSTMSYDGTMYEVCLIVSSPFGESQCDSIYCDSIRVGYAKGLYVPNALTPDANYGLIKEFLPAGKSLESYKLQIFDTWGNLIWESTSLDENGSPKIGWRGMNYKGVPVPQGVYVWKIDARFSDGAPWLGGENGKKVGSVTLIR
jgi:PKD repeat protein